MEKIKQKKHPDFICPGAAKSGTTTLFSILENHSDVYLYEGKEIGFFGQKEMYIKGYKWYQENYFSNNKGYKISGDISTNYMTYSKVAAKRIYDTLGPEVKLIFILRNPAERAYSHYNMRKFNNLSEEESFSSLVSKLEYDKKAFSKKYTNKLSSNFNALSKEEQQDWKKLNYFFLGNYAEILKDYLDYFSKKNMLIIKFDDFVKNQSDIMQRVYSFLEVNQQNNLKINHMNPSGKIKYVFLHKLFKKISNLIRKFGGEKVILNNKTITRMFYKYKNWNREANKAHLQPMYLKDRQRLNHYYKKDIHKLEEITGQQFMDWVNDI